MALPLGPRPLDGLAPLIGRPGPFEFRPQPLDLGSARLQLLRQSFVPGKPTLEILDERPEAIAFRSGLLQVPDQRLIPPRLLPNPLDLVAHLLHLTLELVATLPCLDQLLFHVGIFLIP